MRYGILGGTFDPIHEGHLDLAKVALEKTDLKKIYFIPTGRNPEKEAPAANSFHRFKMVETALRELNHPSIFLLDWEVHQEPAYTIDTLKRWQREFEATPVLILGSEVFEKFQHWKKPEEILTASDILLVPRGGNLEVKKEVSTQSPRRIDTLPYTPLPYSGTALRKTLREFNRNSDIPPPGLTRGVWAYIKKNSLYTE